MKRALARLGVLALVVGSPFALGSLVGSPMIPDFRGSDGLSGTFVPVDAVLRFVGLFAWALWAYLAFAVLLHASAVVAASRGAQGHRALLLASSIFTPKVLRSLVEFAVGGAFLAASVSWHAPPVARAVGPTVFVQAGDARPTVGIDRAASSEPVRETYRVRPGDSLWRIAERELGSGFRWREIYRLNQGKRFADGRSLTNPRLIYPGWVLDLPKEDRATPGPENQGADECPSHQEHATPTSPPTSGTPVPTPTYASPAQHVSPEPKSDLEPEEPEAPSPGNPVLQFPSGLLVAASFASGLLTAHLLAKLRRRRSRRLSGMQSAEPSATPELIRDLRRAGASEMTGPMDVALDAVIETWRAQTGSWPHLIVAVEAQRHVSVILGESDVELPRSSGGTLSPRVRFARAGPTVIAEVEGPFPVQLRQSRSPLERGLLVPLGVAPDGSVVHVSATGLGQVSITGPKAASLVRQIVLAAATQGGPDDLRLVLLGPGEEIKTLCRLPQVAGCHGWEEASEALRELQLEFICRARLFLQEGVDDIHGHLAEHSDERLPALLILCEEPPLPLRGLIEALGQEARTLGAAILALGWASEGAGLVARVDQPMELETDLRCPRVLEPFLLDASAGQEAIEVIRDAYPPESIERSVANEAAETVQEVQAPTPLEVRTALSPHRPIAETERLLPPPPTEPPAPPPDMLAIRCLGTYEISRAGRSLPTGWKAKGRELVAYLVAHPAGAPKERIIEELWPGIDPKQGGARFDRYATLVRAHARGTEDSRTYVERVGDSSYRLEEDAWWVDAWEFERLVLDAERSADMTEAVTKLRNALALYGGEFCDDAYYPWLEGVRERFRNLFIEACGRLADLLSGAGEREEALSVLDRAIKTDPVCEDLVRRAMAIEGALGRRAAALARYRKLEATLDEQLGVEPDPETQALVQRLLGPSASEGA